MITGDITLTYKTERFWEKKTLLCSEIELPSIAETWIHDKNLTIEVA